ncbi:hypothetical protein CSUI_001826, partial [Cystoisospora suis]
MKGGVPFSFFFFFFLSVCFLFMNFFSSLEGLAPWCLSSPIVLGTLFCVRTMSPNSMTKLFAILF